MAFRILNILIMKFLYILFSFLFLSNSYANGDQLIPNGNKADLASREIIKELLLNL